MTFETYTPCSGNGDFCGMRVLAKGRIETDSADKLQAFLTSRAAKDKYFNKNPTLVFDSPGGSLLGRIALGRLIRRLKLDTELAPIYTEEVRDRSPDGYHDRIVATDVICASACSLAFIGGVRRTIAQGGRFGVHQFSTIGGNLSEGDSQVTVTTLASYVASMGVDRQMIDIASVTASNSIRWIAPEVARQLRIDNTISPLSSWSIVVEKSGVPRLTVRQEIASGHMVLLSFVEVGGEYLLSVMAAFSLQQFQATRLGQFPVSEQGNIQFIVDQRQKIRPKALDAWFFELNQRDGWATFRANFHLSRAQMEALRMATTLQIDDEFGRATSDISSTTDLSVENLAGGVSLLLRNRR
ncbi:hypothetical protein [Herbaspirillum sp. C7C8]|uniref:COG3904 family protein n=1 Tax=Herbaspirillum sp. C7C8 TaxID=2736665 RepID=UPI001F519E7E|nr:hypothetical protein [Herbaspirillum sp. C7C8]MCI1005697.1 hypothetical protein [Herbaspirillum sp. C7C8]